MKHGLELAFAHYLATMFIFIGKLAISLLNVGFTWILIKYAFKLYDGPNPLSSALGPLLIIFFVTYLATIVFLSLFDEAVLALMTCVSVDSDLNNGTPKYGPPTFHDSLSNVRAHPKNKVSGIYDKQN